MNSGTTSETNRERHRAGLLRASTILEERFPEFHISKRRLRKAESIQLIRDRRQAANQQIGFASRPFVLCGLPVRRPPQSSLVYERRNGLFTLQITGHPDFGLPFGQDRLVPIFLATLAVRQQSQTIRFKSAAQMLETFGMAKGGKEYRRLVAAFERIFGATIFFGTESTRTQARVVQRSRFNFLSEAQIWFNRDPAQEVLSSGFENVVVLSDEFYKEVIAHPIPADIEAVKAFGSAPAVLDLFMWLTYRCFTAKSEERIPLFGNLGDRGDFVACLNIGWAKFVPSGRNVQRGSAPMASICDSVRRKLFCRPPPNTRDFTCAAAITAHTIASLVVGPEKARKHCAGGPRPPFQHCLRT